MLRDLPPLGRRLSHNEHLLMNGAQGEENYHHDDPLDDVFGSAPSSPTLNAQDSRDLGSGPDRAEHSDIPRLRSIHVTNGYREGIAISKEKYIQEGFDEGFSLGGEVGMRVGWTLGVLEGICTALRKIDRQSNGHPKGEQVKAILQEARDELKVETLLGKTYFGPDGIWIYDVPGQDVEGQVTFADVANAHPLLQKWKQTVYALAENYGLVFE